MERAGNEELTEDTEKKGLGTPATRAAIIEKLIQSGFVKREKKNLVPTDDGNVLITVLPDEIKSPKMTAEWEMALNHIAQNTETADEFLNGITELMQELVARYQGISEEKKNQFQGKAKREVIQKHEMKDDVTKVEISKTDITGETEIPGAKLTILDKDDQVVESWTSTEEAHYIEKLPIGKYTLREEQAPKGYLLTADVTFEVKDTGEIQKVAMKDDTAKGKVILNKTDKSSGEPLKGVEFELRDSKGKVLETLKTDAAGHVESKLYEIATFKNGKYDTAIKYYLVETKTLDGYTLDQTKHEVTFAYANDSTPVVEVTFNLTNEKPEVPETPNTPDTPQSHEETKVSNAPKTGDSTNIWLPLLLLVISTGGMAGLYISRKRKTK